MSRSHAALVFALLLGSLVLVAVPSGQAIDVTGGNMELGKVPLGFVGTFTRDVANSDDAEVVVGTTIECGCPVYVTADPLEFTLGAGEKRTVTLRVEVPMDADPGIHENTVRFTARAPSGGGNVATGAVAVHVTFYPVTARLYADVLDEHIGARFISSLEENVSVTVVGDLTGPGMQRTFAPQMADAPRSERASTTRFTLPIPFEPTDPDGVYRIDLQATWSNASTGLGGSSNLTLDILRGPAVQLIGFTATAKADGLHFAGTLKNIADLALDAWMVVEVTGPAGAKQVVETGRVRIEAGASAPVETFWEEAGGGTYTVTAYASYVTGSGQTGQSAAGDPVSVAGPSAGAPAGPGGGGVDGEVTRLALVALVGIGVGAVVAIAVNRRKPKT